MSEQVFSLSVNQVMAYAAVTSALLAIVLAVITLYYAHHAKRQADASREQVAASNRQADAAQRTLDLLLNEKEQQRLIDVSTVSLQLQVAIHLIEDWQNRISSESFDLPDVIEMLPTSFNGAVTSADSRDDLYMCAETLCPKATQSLVSKRSSSFISGEFLSFELSLRRI
jgi:cell division protein FtsL